MELLFCVPILGHLERTKTGTACLFSKWCWESWTVACKSMKLEHTLRPYTKINSKWLKDLNVKTWHHKTPRREYSKTFSDINHTNVFLGQSLKAIEIKAKINKWDLIKHTSFHTAKETIKKKKEKKTYRMKENICKWCNWPGLNLQNAQTAPTTQQWKIQTTQLKNGQKT